MGVRAKIKKEEKLLALNVYVLANTLIEYMDELGTSQKVKKGLRQNLLKVTKGIEHFDDGVIKTLIADKNTGAYDIVVERGKELDEVLNKPIKYTE